MPPQRVSKATGAVDEMEPAPMADVAGTTVDEGGTVYRVLAETVRAAGGDSSPAQIEAWMGASKREAIQALLTAYDRLDDRVEVIRRLEHRGELLGRDQSSHHAAHRIAIDDAERGQAEQRSLPEQILGRGGAAQERVMGRDLEFGVACGGWAHPNTPWRYQLRSPVSPCSPSPRRNSQ